MGKWPKSIKWPKITFRGLIWVPKVSYWGFFEFRLNMTISLKITNAEKGEGIPFKVFNNYCPKLF